MEKKTTIIWIVLLGVVVLLGGGLAAWVELSWIADKKADLKKETDTANSMQKKANELGTLEKQKTELVEKSAQECLKIPDFTPDEFDNFVDTVEQMRRRSNTYIGVAQVKSERRTKGASPLPKNVKKITYQLDMGGAFYPLVRFINLAETQKRFIKVETCTLSSSQAQERTPMDREMNITLSTYAYDMQLSGKDAEEKKEDPKEKPPVETTPIPAP